MVLDYLIVMFADGDRKDYLLNVYHVSECFEPHAIGDFMPWSRLSYCLKFRVCIKTATVGRGFAVRVLVVPS